MLDAEWLGRRVSVRRVVERRPDGSLHQGDVVGDLVGLDAQTAVVETSGGLVEVPVALVTAARLAPPSTADELALEAVISRSMRAVDTEQVGGWLLRADHGFLRRSNSVLPLTQPGMPIADALERTREWYRERDVRVRIALPTEARRLLDADLAERGWPVDQEAHVMTGRLDHLSAPPQDTEIELVDAPDDSWLRLYRGGEGLSSEGRALLTRHDQVVFAAGHEDGETIAVARGVVDEGWLGVSGVEVAAHARRRGLATAMMHRLFEWGREHGASRSYLQVESENAVAIGLYERLGYRVHHDYRYRLDPGA